MVAGGPLLHSDAPAFSYYVFRTPKLLKATGPAGLVEDLPDARLELLSEAHGLMHGDQGGTTTFETRSSRVSVALRMGFLAGGEHVRAFEYSIRAGNAKTWDLVDVHGTAVADGKGFITQDWRKQPVTVVIRPVNLKR